MALSRSDCREVRRALSGKATGYRYDEVARWLRRADFDPPVGSGGSHRVWFHAATSRIAQLVDKGHGELLPVYVKQAAKVILEVGGCDGQE